MKENSIMILVAVISLTALVAGVGLSLLQPLIDSIMKTKKNKNKGNGTKTSQLTAKIIVKRETVNGDPFVFDVEFTPEFDKRLQRLYNKNALIGGTIETDNWFLTDSIAWYPPDNIRVIITMEIQGLSERYQIFIDDVNKYKFAVATPLFPILK